MAVLTIHKLFVLDKGYTLQNAPPFDASTFVLFRKRITADMLGKANECLLAHKDDGHPKPPSSGKDTDESGLPKEEAGNKGTLAIDATCAPANIRYPQDISLLNEAREKLEHMIYRMCKSYGLQLPGAIAGKQGKTIWPLPRAGSMAKSRYGQQSGNSFPMCAGTLAAWKVISARVMCRMPKISLLF